MTAAPGRLVLGPAVFKDLMTAVTEGGPHERCGILFGVTQVGVAFTAGCAQLKNAAEDPVHNYAFDPEDQARTWARVEAMGYQVLGVWHTHPTGPPGPSETDLAHAQQWFLYPILWPEEQGGASLEVYALADNEAGYRVVPCEVKEGAYAGGYVRKADAPGRR